MDVGLSNTFKVSPQTPKIVIFTRSNMQPLERVECQLDNQKHMMIRLKSSITYHSEPNKFVKDYPQETIFAPKGHSLCQAFWSML